MKSCDPSPPPQASKVATNLVLSNLKGHDSHGVGYLPRYINGVCDGLIPTDQKARRRAIPTRQEDMRTLDCARAQDPARRHRACAHRCPLCASLPRPASGPRLEASPR